MLPCDIVFSDLDGTLLDPAGRITQASKDAIARARAAEWKMGKG